MTGEIFKISLTNKLRSDKIRFDFESYHNIGENCKLKQLKGEYNNPFVTAILAGHVGVVTGYTAAIIVSLHCFL